jgi:tetratricopeptide (TPR) repeat protein
MPLGDYNKGRFTSHRKTADDLLKQAQQLVARGDYTNAEALCTKALNGWRAASGSRQEEGRLIMLLGKCYEAQRKYEQAYELYIESLKNLTGATYDDVYTSLLYLNERMGTFTKKNPSDQF